ncbi:MAG TPA: TonB-dependent receptor [Woeseiaceae bacterium]|nr:TonB-dependent receptor [Woeseiaceae bacterium]
MFLNGRAAFLSSIFALLSVLATVASAQSNIDEITVTAPARDKRALAPAVELDRARIAEIAAVALTDIFKTVPSVGIRTNSRGEAVLRLRGSEERQTGIFLDGAPLSVPWDGRVDLSALPAGIVEQVRVTASAAPIEYGANSVLGVVDIRSPVSPEPGLLSLQAEAGTAQSGSLGASFGAKAGGMDWLFGGGYRRIGGEAVASTSVIPYATVTDGERINTDLESSSLFVAAGKDFTQGSARLSLFSVAAERGIASQGHIDPDSGSPRYWRYPRWRFDQLTLNSTVNVGAGMGLRSTVWFQHFEQTIDQYTDDSYTLLESSEDDKDKTLGLRLVLERPQDRFDVRLIGNAQVTTHDQLDTDYAAGIQGPLQSYRQDIFSIGAEVDTAIVDKVKLSTALSYDLATTPETGGRDPQEDLSDWAASMALRWNPVDAWQITGSLGQRTRFPSLRELYGVALGQFVVNPALQPETALLGDVSFERNSRGGELRLRVTPWTLHIDDTLSQRFVTIDGVRLRQRYNLQGSDGYGLEAGVDWFIDDRLELRLHGNWQKLEARVEADGTRPELLLRPEFQASFIVDWLFSENWDLYLEVRHMGTALDEEEDGTIVELPTSTEMNMRLFRVLQQGVAGRWRAYIGIENASDEIILPQLGLPQPGRTVSLGVTFERI